jgi:tyrosyl-tRNA synthetase
MPAFAPVAEQLALLERGIADFHTRADLESRLEASRAGGTPLRVKAGFDPTRPDLHLGHTVLLQKMRQFQDLGHVAIFLIGDFTARVGDPTGQNESRPRLTREEIDRASDTYLQQAFKVLDPARVEVRKNREWIDRLTMDDTVELMAKYTVSRMLERKEFAARFQENRPIYQHEFLYPLLQGYDSVALECDVELGGTDQLFNLLVGRDLMGRYGKRPQIVMTTPLLEGTDARVEDGEIVGKKMSKSADNYIGIQEAPVSMYRKVMQIDDQVIFRFFKLLSSRSNAEIAALEGEMAAGRDPREIKGLFAGEIIARFHGQVAAERAAAEYERMYTGNAPPEDLPCIEIAPPGGVAQLAWALKQANLVPSTSEARRLVEQGGVEVNGARVTDPKAPLSPGGEYLVRVGSKNRRFARIRVIG